MEPYAVSSRTGFALFGAYERTLIPHWVNVTPLLISIFGLFLALLRILSERLRRALWILLEILIVEGEGEERKGLIVG